MATDPRTSARVGVTRHNAHRPTRTGDTPPAKPSKAKGSKAKGSKASKAKGSKAKGSKAK